MKKRLFPAICVWTLVALAGGPDALANSPPVVSNVIASQRPDASKLVDIYYDLYDADGDACTVTVLASDDGGATWAVPIKSTMGDVGAGILPGAARHIIWDTSADIPGVSGSQFKIRVCADSSSHTPGAMVLIPAGEYLMGDHHDGMSDAPVHAVYIDSFYMDVYQTTNAQYAAALNWAKAQNLIVVSGGLVRDATTNTPYCDTTSSSSFSRIVYSGGVFSVTPTKENHPMVRVSWHGAAAYANWRSLMEGRQPSYNLTTWACNFAADGYRLPTEAEWEKAARGGEHNSYYRYPWGNTIDGSKANYLNSGDPWESGPSPKTSPVGYYDGNQIPAGVDMANGYGLYDMAGNVWEWCNDWYSSTYYQNSPYDNPKGPGSGTQRVLRGGSWGNLDGSLRCAHRHWNNPGSRSSHFGFRLSLD